MKKSNAKTKRARTPGERLSVFYLKGKAQVRLRLFPFPDGYRVSAVRTEEGKPSERSVQEFPGSAEAKAHLETLGALAVKNGYTKRVGTRGDNAVLLK